MQFSHYLKIYKPFISEILNRSKGSKVLKTKQKHNKNAYQKHKNKHGGLGNATKDTANDPNKGQLFHGIVVGAGVVTFVLVVAFLAYRFHTNKRRSKLKNFLYRQPNTSQGVSSEVTLMPVQRAQESSENQRRYRSRLVHVHSCEGGHERVHYPPSYNECFLDNGGSVVAV